MNKIPVRLLLLISMWVFISNARGESVPSSEQIARAVKGMCQNATETSAMSGGLPRHDLTFEVLKVGDPTTMIAANGTSVPAWPVKIKYTGLVTLGWDGPISKPDTRTVEGDYTFLLFKDNLKQIGYNFDLDRFGGDLISKWKVGTPAVTEDQAKKIAQAFEEGPKAVSGEFDKGPWKNIWSIRILPKAANGHWHAVVLWKNGMALDEGPKIDGGFFVLSNGEAVMKFDEAITDATKRTIFYVGLERCDGWTFQTVRNANHKAVLEPQALKLFNVVPMRFFDIQKQSSDQKVVDFKKPIDSYGVFVVNAQGGATFKTRESKTFFDEVDIKAMATVPGLVEELASEKFNQMIAENLEKRKQDKEAKARADLIK